MYLRIDDQKINVTFTPQFDEISKHTSKPLRTYELTIITRSKSEVDQLNNWISKSKNELQLGDNTGSETTWKIEKSGYTYSESENPVYKFWINVIEKETLNPDRLVIDDNEVFPYYYEEHFIDDSLLIDIKAKVDQALFEKLVDDFQEKETVAVVREGISTEKRMMGLAIITWSLDNNLIKVQIYLSDSDKPENKSGLLAPFMIFGRQIRNLRQETIFQSSIINKLLGLLKEKKVITDAELNQLMTLDNQQGELFTRIIDFSQEEDIDKE